MATSLAIKRRIKSVKNISQVTKTMEIVSASRMKKVQESAQRLKPYSQSIRNILDKALITADTDVLNNIFFATREGKNLVILISPTRGLAGALPSSIISKLFSWIKENGENNSFICLNKKGFKSVKKQNYDVISFYENITNKTEISELDPISEEIKDLFKDKYANVYLVYPKFINTMRQEPVVEKLLPIQTDNLAEAAEGYLFEPGAKQIIDEVIPQYIEIKLYDAVINTSASEESARMLAMKNATDNAHDMIDDLVLSFNKARQMKITQQVAEISAAL